MQKLRYLLLACVAMATITVAPAQRTGNKVIDAGEVILEGTNAIAVHVSGATGELDSLANVAFRSHGRYRRVVAGSATYDIHFSATGPNQVSVQIRKGDNVVLNQSVNGTSTRNALLRAADIAVKATSGLPGFFASRLAFVSGRTGKDEVYISDLFLGEVKQLTRDGAHALTPRWSPDGSKLIYTSYFRSGFPDIFLLNLGTMQRTSFISFQGTNSGARFSPNGQQVAMVLSGEGTPEVYVSNASGRQVSRRTKSPNVKSSPCWSPDGSQIVYASEPGPQLYIMPASGGGGRRVTTGISSYCAEPDWCRADSNKIAFTFREGKVFQIAVLDLKTGQSKKVSKAPLDAVEPAWLADGRHLIYTARAAGTRALFILDTESGRTTSISSVPAEKASVWGP